MLFPCELTCHLILRSLGWSGLSEILEGTICKGWDASKRLCCPDLGQRSLPRPSGHGWWLLRVQSHCRNCLQAQGPSSLKVTPHPRWGTEGWPLAPIRDSSRVQEFRMGLVAVPCFESESYRAQLPRPASPHADIHSSLLVWNPTSEPRFYSE